MKKQTLETHPMIYTYKETEIKDFPVILVIGREPNSPLPIDDKIGNYDFEEYPRCGFWNMSYSSLGKLVGLRSAGETKKEMKNKQSSFIAYADLSYQGIPNEIANKGNFRKNLNTVLMKKHIDDLYNHDFVKNRVDLILFSGIENVGFSKEILHYAFEKCPVEYVKIPFFYGTNAQKIDNEIIKAEEKVKEIYSKWKNHN